jgi:hypothetical protein
VLRWHYLGQQAPPSPGLRIVPGDNAVHIYWDDSSEHSKDLILNQIDFESYRIWRASGWERPLGTSLDNGPPSDLWRLVTEFDLINFTTDPHAPGGSETEEMIPFGANTGLDPIRYRPVCLDHSRFSGLAAAMQVVIDRDSLNLYLERPALRDHVGNPVPDLEGLLPWEAYPAVLDTFFMVAVREEDHDAGVIGKRGLNFYEYVDDRVHNGFIYFYSVTATDHLLDLSGSEPQIAGKGVGGDPTGSFVHAVPGFPAQTAEQRLRHGSEVFVYPNPVTRDALAEFQQLYPNADDPTGVRIMFANLPQARNRITIYTLDGDLVAEIAHDGREGYGQASWNLVTRNGQQIVSGLYLYVVESEDSRFEDFIGKFAVIR